MIIFNKTISLKKILVFVTVIVLLGVGINFGLSMFDRQGRICNDKLIFDAKQALNTSSGTESVKVIKQIEKLDDYQEDPNCMYAVTLHYLTIGNLSKAEQSLSVLRKVYVTKADISSLYKPGILSLSDFDEQIKFQKKILDQQIQYLGPSDDIPKEKAPSSNEDS